MSWNTFPPIAAVLVLAASSIVSAAEPGDLVQGPVHVDLASWVPPESSISDDQRPQQLGDKIVYVNFDGADMNSGCGNKPQNNCSTIFSGVVLPFPGDKSLRAAIIQVIRKKVADFGISITDQRPASGDYDMEMVGPWQGQDTGSTAGVAPGIDCWDNQGGQVSFTMIGGNADGVAEVILQEIAHTWGLAHVDEGTDLLFPTTQGSNKWFRDECYQIVSDTNLSPSSSGCSHHTQACGSNSKQNSHAELLLIFGTGQPDTIAPVVDILAPNDGEQFASGAEVTLEVALNDNQSPMIFDTKVILEGDTLATPVESVAAYAGPTELKFPLKGLPDGNYTATVEVQDEEDNAASDQVSFKVGTPGSSSSSSTESGGTTDGGTSGSSTGEPGTSSSGDSSGSSSSTGPSGDTEPGFEDDEGKACACSSEGFGSRAGWLSLLLLGAARRRR